jgi:hypothetical protein
MIAGLAHYLTLAVLGGVHHAYIRIPAMVAVCLPGGSAWPPTWPSIRAFCTGPDPFLPKTRSIWSFLPRFSGWPSSMRAAFCSRDSPGESLDIPSLIGCISSRSQICSGCMGSLFGGAFQCCRLCAAAVPCRKAWRGMWWTSGGPCRPIVTAPFADRFMCLVTEHANRGHG